MASPIYREPSSFFVDTSNDKATLQSDAIGVANTPGLSLINNTAGASNAPQFSPTVELITQGFAAASVINKFTIQLQSVSGAWNYTGRNGDGYLSFSAVYNNGAASQIGIIDGYGNFNINGFSTFIGTSTLVPSITWTAVTFQNSFSNISGAAACSYIKDAGGMVRLKGGGTGGTAGNVMFTLPAGYRPSNNYYFCMTANSNFLSCVLIVGSDGTVKTSGVANSGTNCYVDGVHFLAEA